MPYMPGLLAWISEIREYPNIQSMKTIQPIILLIVAAFIALTGYAQNPSTSTLKPVAAVKNSSTNQKNIDAKPAVTAYAEPTVKQNEYAGAEEDLKARDAETALIAAEAEKHAAQQAKLHVAKSTALKASK